MAAQLTFDFINKQEKRVVYWSEKVQDDFDYYSDDAEAVVYIITMAGAYGWYFVMKRSDAVKFCSHKKSSGTGAGGVWAFAFTTYKRNWREELSSFKIDDNRFEKLFKELGIKLIFSVTPRKKKGSSEDES